MGFLSTLGRFSLKLSKQTQLSSAVREISVAAHSTMPLLGRVFGDVSRYKIVQNFLHITDTPLSRVFQLFKSGKFAEAMRNVDPKFTIRSLDLSALRSLRLQASRFPSFHLQKVSDATDSLKKILNRTDDIADKATFSQLVATHVGDSTSKFGQVLRSASKINAKGVTIALGTTIAAVGFANFFEQYRQQLNGCMRYALVDGELTACKVFNCSCQAKLNHPRHTKYGISACDPVRDKLPLVVTETRCNETSATPCQHCNSSDNDPALLDTSVEFRCLNYGFLGAVADYMGNHAETIMGEVDGIHAGISETSMNGLAVLKIAVPTFFAAIAIFIIIASYFWFFSGKSGVVYRDDDRDRFDENDDDQRSPLLPANQAIK